MTEHRKGRWQVGGKFFKYYCPFCKAEYMNNKLSFCVVCGAKLEKGKKQNERTRQIEANA